jgi:hypothetical protein
VDSPPVLHGASQAVGGAVPPKMPSLGVPADQDHQCEVVKLGEHFLVPGLRALAARRQVAALVVVAGEAEAHRHDGHFAGIVEIAVAYAEPAFEPGARGVSVGPPETCTRRPGAWLAMQIRAMREAWTTGRGSCGKGGPYRGASRQIRQRRTWTSRVSRSASGDGAVISAAGLRGTRSPPQPHWPARQPRLAGHLPLATLPTGLGRRSQQ